MRRVVIVRSAKKYLDTLDVKTRDRMLRKILQLEMDPRPPNCVKLAGTKNGYRIRIGSYRILYEVHDDQLVVLVIKISLRSNAYWIRNQSTYSPIAHRSQ